jgi:hypothetical protein
LAENVNSNGLYVAEDVMVSFSGKDVFEGAIVEVGAGEEVQDVIKRVRRIVRIKSGSIEVSCCFLSWRNRVF